MATPAFNPDTPWRRVAAAMYQKPVDSKIFGAVEIDVTELEAYIARKRQEGLKITLTHIFLLATARAFREEIPEFNCIIQRGRAVARRQIDATLSVLIRGDSEMGSIRVSRADELTLAELAEQLALEMNKTKKGAENNTMRFKALLAAVPWPFRGWLLGLIRKITVDWGLSFPRAGITADSLGSFVLTNIGSIGLDMGFPAMLPAANVSLVLVVGGVNTKPWVVDGQITPRRILSLGAALDHRVVDGVHGGKLFRYLKRVLRRPEVLEQKPDAGSPS
jgi:pyruvate/2-oxoglutarate dehydrogenase complex dihydrolipoamide acyltransferase (E2) component